MPPIQWKVIFQVSAIIRLFLLTAFFASIVFSQYRFDQWTADNGLPQNSVYSIIQTRDGYLWLATVDGLARFDGVNFTIFNKSNSPKITSNRFTGLFEDANGSLWATTEDSGIIRYYQGEFTSFGIESGLTLAEVHNITGDSSGNLLAIINNNQFYRFADGKFSEVSLKTTFQSVSPPIKSESFISLCFSSDEKKELTCIWDEQIITVSYPDKFSKLTLINSIQDGDGDVWILTKEAGLIHLEKGKIAKVYTKEDNLPENPLLLMTGRRLSLLSNDKEGALWLTDLKTKTSELLARIPPPSLGIVHIGYEDYEGNLWLGSLRGGLFRVRKQIITTYSKVDGLLENNVYPIFEDRQGVIWIGTTNGVFKYQNGSFSLVKNSENIYAEALGTDSLGRLLVSSRSGLYVFEEEKFRHFYQNNFGVIWAIHSDSENNLWLGSQEGLFRLKDKEETRFTTQNGLAGDNVKVIIDDRNGGLWIGSHGGLTHLKDGKFQKWTTAEGLPNPTIRSLYLDSENVLWIGSYDSGLARFKDGKFTHYNPKNGLFNDGAFQILEDDQRNLWLSSNRGIYHVKKDELNELADGKRSSITSVAYGKSDGMLNVEANGGRMPSGIKARDGRLWFPTQDGAAVINPKEIKINRKPPPVIIEDLKIDDKSIEVKTIKSALNELQTAIQIDPSQQNFEIKYTALSFINPENLRFKYKLEGLDTEWIEAGTRRTAYFSHVAPGDYTFRVIAANTDGIWNETGTAIKIKILPPFYRTWWFLTVVVLSLMCLTYLIYRRRVSQLEREKKAQEELSRRLIELQENERKRLAGELHDSLSQNLVIIKNRAMMSLAERENVEYAFEQIEEIAEAAAESLSEVRGIAATLRPFQIDRLGLTRSIQALVRKAASPNLEIAIHIDDIDGLLLPEMEINLYRILQEALNNIIKHSEATAAKISIEKTEKTIIIKISDNGKGFDINKRPEENEVGGFGLTGMSERARILGSALMIESSVGSGVLIHFQINY